mmetsp:Transcript_39131/g.92054  ORF Transcript_39131/g.92054 Transcript_39131/m.92054 type:complete len:1199 (-) Transcript_39131:92-3688(-)
MSASLSSSPQTLEPLATFPVADIGDVRAEDWRRPQEYMQAYARFGPDMTVGNRRDAFVREDGPPGLPDFLGRLHQMKTLLRMSATQDPISLMIHRAGPLLILDDGPRGWTRGAEEQQQEQPVHELDDFPLQDGAGSDFAANSELTLAALDSAMETALHAHAQINPPPTPPMRPPPGLSLPELPANCTGPNARVFVKNTFVDVVEDEERDDIGRTQSAPGRMGPDVQSQTRSVRRGASPRVSSAAWSTALAPVLQRLPKHAQRDEDTGNWSLMPYAADSVAASASQWDLLQLASAGNVPPRLSIIEAMRSLHPGIPKQPSRFGRAVAWRCGPYKILLGCDLVVFRSDDKRDVSDCASFKMLPGSAAEPSREERLDVYLENLMCDIKQVVWGIRRQEADQTTWRLTNTKDLPSSSAAATEESDFDPVSLLEEGQRLLHFLRQKCNKEGGTYWLFREANSPIAELFDLSHTTEPQPTLEDSDAHRVELRAFKTTDSLVLPIASLCLHLAKSLPDRTQKKQLLQKSLHLLESVRDQFVTAYAMAALELSCLYMRAPQAALPDLPGRGQPQSVADAPPAAARLSVALRYLESILSLPRLEGEELDRDGLVHAELMLQADVAYAECIVKLVRETFIPTYSAWLNEVQQNSAEMLKSDSTVLNEMKRISAAFLLWRIFWLCRAQSALSVLPQEKREVECWVLDRDLCETMGDALYGLSRYPASDIDNLLDGDMRSAEGICSLVERALRTFGLEGSKTTLLEQPPAVPEKKQRKRRLTSPTKQGYTSPASSPRRPEQEATKPHNVTAMFLSKLNPLTRGVRDATLREDPLVRDDRRKRFWTDRLAFHQSLALFERAAARLKKYLPTEAGPQKVHTVHSAEEQATLKVARKLAHFYNEEARTALIEADGTERAEELLTNAHHWMFISGDLTNAGRVLLNLSELHARRAERLSAPSEEGAQFTHEQYKMYIQAVECATEATRICGNKLGVREMAFAHLRLGVHLATRSMSQAKVEGAGAPQESMIELADKHISKALLHFDELKDEREVAVCHFHLADLVMKEHSIASAPLSKARLTSALRHARRSADYWERAGGLQYIQDFLSAHVRVARLLELQPKPLASMDALEHLSSAEEKLLTLAESSQESQEKWRAADGQKPFVEQGGRNVAVSVLRREMGRICQAGLKEGTEVGKLKVLYRSILRNESVKVR